MKLYRQIACVVAFGITTSGMAQQVPLHSQQQFNPFIYNPAYTGFHDLIDLNFTHRAQWTAIEGAPVTSVFTADGQFISDKIGLGLVFFNDMTGITKRTGGYADYSYKLDIDDGHTIRLGLAFGAINNRIDFSDAAVQDAQDPLLFSAGQSRTSIDGNFGVMYNWEEQNLEVGIATPHLFGNKLRYRGQDNVRTYYQLARHYLFSAKYRYDFDADWSASPLVLLRFVPGAPLQYDINATGSYQDWIWLGFTYKSNYAIGVNTRVAIHDKRLAIGFSYDLIVGDMQGYTGAAGEFSLRYRFAMKGGGGGSASLRGKYD